MTWSIFPQKVIYLLYASGTISKFMEEMRSGSSIIESSKSKKLAPQRENVPLLCKFLLTCLYSYRSLYVIYWLQDDFLLDATKTLALKPSIPVLKGKKIVLRPLSTTENSNDLNELFIACNGGALFGESAYDPSRIWGWLDMSQEEYEVLTNYWNDRTIHISTCTLYNFVVFDFVFFVSHDFLTMCRSHFKLR